MSTSNKKHETIPKLDIKLRGEENFAEWILLIEMYLGMQDVDKYTIWDIVTRRI
jgi:hypothetical protein